MIRKSFHSRIYPIIFGLLSSITLTTSMNALGGDIYKWTDENGVIHYSDIKPGHSGAQSVEVKTVKSTKTTESVQDKARSLDEAKQQQDEEQAKKLQQGSYERDVEARCQIVRDNLKKFEENSRIKIKEDDKERFLAPEEITSKKAEYQRILDEQCK